MLLKGSGANSGNVEDGRLGGAALKVLLPPHARSPVS